MIKERDFSSPLADAADLSLARFPLWGSSEQIRDGLQSLNHWNFFHLQSEYLAVEYENLFQSMRLEYLSWILSEMDPIKLLNSSIWDVILTPIAFYSYITHYLVHFQSKKIVQHEKYFSRVSRDTLFPIVWSRYRIFQKWWRHFDTFCRLLLTLGTFSDFLVSKKVVQHEKPFPTIYNMAMFGDIKDFKKIQNSPFWNFRHYEKCPRCAKWNSMVFHS